MSRGAPPPSPENIRQWDVEHLWHPFSQMAEYAATDRLVVVSAEGNHLIDDRGRRLFDATSALWCNLLGHRVPEIDAALTDQLGRIAHSTLLGATHPSAAELARRLVEIAPKGLNHVFFSDNGATAVEAALKIAFQYRLLTQGPEAAARAVYLSLENAYHGDTLGAAAVGGVELFHETFRPILLPTLKTRGALLLPLPAREDAGRLSHRPRPRAGSRPGAGRGARLRRRPRAGCPGGGRDDRAA